MTYKLSVEINHKSFDEPLTKEFYYTGDSLDDILEQIETIPFHRHNLKLHKHTAFKDDRGVKHSWKLYLMDHLN